MTSFIVFRAWPIPSSHTARSTVRTAFSRATFSTSSRVMSRMKPAATRLRRATASGVHRNAPAAVASWVRRGPPGLDIARDDLVHRVPGVADPLLAHRQVDRQDGLLAGDLLDLLPGHVAHEARRHPVETGHRLRRPPKRARGRRLLGPRLRRRRELGPREQRLPPGPELVPPDRVLDERQRQLAGDDRDPP